MRVIQAIVAAAVVAAPASGLGLSPLARETAVWDAVKAKKMDIFAASMTHDFIGVYAWGTHDKAQELRVVHNQSLRDFKIGNFRAHMVDADNMLTTYTADVRGTEDGKSFSGRYWNTSLWHRSGARWLTAYHSEAKAH
jgi:hypothetical protein